jgi:hypothetical protein
MEMSSLDALRTLESDWRKYSSNGWYKRVIRPLLLQALASQPEKNLSDFYEDLDLMEQGTRDLVQVKSLVAWGSEDLGLVERAFDVKLPLWAHHFYQNVRFAVLGLRNPVRLLTPEQMVAYEVRQREAELSAGLPVVPVRMIIFADAGIEGNNFAFRQNTQTNQWEIAFSPLVDTREVLQSAQCEEWVQFDLDFDHWLDRMIRTDGHPLQTGRDDEICYTERELNQKNGTDSTSLGEA